LAEWLRSNAGSNYRATGFAAARRENPTIPEGGSATMSDTNRKRSPAVIPMVVCRDAAAEIDFCKAAFGAVELSRRAAPDGAVVHATLAIGGALIMVHGEISNLASRAPVPDGSSPVVIYVYVEDTDVVIERALAAGATILIPAANQFWGDRVGRIIDPAGYVWNVAARIGGEVIRQD
jgi:PhnB protein